MNKYWTVKTFDPNCGLIFQNLDINRAFSDNFTTKAAPFCLGDRTVTFIFIL